MSLQSLAVACVVAVTLVACHETSEAPAEKPRPIQVRVSAAHRGDISEALTITGETAARSVLRLASPIAGRVTMLTVQVGDRVAAGEVAARVISLENDAAVRGFAFLEGASPQSAAERERARKLQRELTARDMALRVPFAAIVSDRLHNPGEQVAQNDVLVEAFDPLSLYALAQVPVDAVARLQTGMAAEVSTRGTTVPGHVAAVAAALTPQTLTVPVRIELDAPLQPPLLHAAVDVRITVVQHTNALLIPRSALLSSTVTDQGTVMVADGHTARQRTVQLGLRTTTDVEVTHGLADGALVLTDGQYALPDESAIEPQPVAVER